MMFPMTEKALSLIADRVSQTTTIRRYENGNSFDDTRRSTDEQQKIVYKIAYGALLGINYACRREHIMLQGVKDSSEFILMQFIPGVNGYDTLYSKLEAVLAVWDNSGFATVPHYNLTGIRNLFPDEIDYIDHRLEYADMNEIQPIIHEDEAQEEIDMILKEGSDPLPEALRDRTLFMLLWNAYVMCK